MRAAALAVTLVVAACAPSDEQLLARAHERLADIQRERATIAADAARRLIDRAEVRVLAPRDIQASIAKQDAELEAQAREIDAERRRLLDENERRVRAEIARLSPR